MYKLSTSHTQKFCEALVLSLLAFSVLWKGGKTLESTWLLFGVGAACVLLHQICKEGGCNTRRRIPAQKMDMWWLITIFILWTAASYLFSTTANYGLDEVLATAGAGFVFLWYTEKTDKGATANAPATFECRIISWIVNIAVLGSAIGLLVYTFQPVNRFVGTFFDIRFHTDYWPNAYAEFLLLAWPITILRHLTPYTDSHGAEHGNTVKRIALYLWNRIPFDAPTALPRAARALLPLRPVLGYLPTGLVLGSLLLTFSRGALIAFFGQIFLLAALILSRREPHKKSYRPLSHISLSLAMGFVVFAGANELRSSFYPIQSATEKITFTASEGRSSISERISFWKQALTMAAEKPIFGWGPYSFRFVQPEYQNSVLATSDHPHNVFLKIGAERGLFAAIVLFAVLYLALQSGIRMSINGKRFFIQDRVRLGYPLVTVAVAGVIAHNLIDYNLQFVGISLPFWLLLGMIVKKTPYHVQSHAFTRQKGKYAAADIVAKGAEKYRNLIVCLIAIVLVAVATREGYFLVTSSLGRRAEKRGEVDRALLWYGKSEGEWFTRDLELSKAHLFEQNEEIEEAKISILKYLDRNSRDARAWKLYGKLMLIREFFDEAVKNYEIAFSYGRWNDLEISRGLLESLFAKTFTQSTSNAAADSKHLPLNPKIAVVAPEIEKLVMKFADAIDRNLHFVTLSPNPEEAEKILIMLSVLFPEKSAYYHTISKNIETKTNNDRKEIRSRNPGWLW